MPIVVSLRIVRHVAVTEAHVWPKAPSGNVASSERARGYSLSPPASNSYASVPQMQCWDLPATINARSFTAAG